MIIQSVNKVDFVPPFSFEMKIFQVAELDIDNNRSDEETIRGAINARESHISSLMHQTTNYDIYYIIYYLYVHYCCGLLIFPHHIWTFYSAVIAFLGEGSIVSEVNLRN